MAMAQISGNHNTINLACISGNFQLNTMLPVIAHNIIESFQLLINSIYSLADTIDTLSINEDNIKISLERNPILATKLNEVVGYDLASKIVKEAYRTDRSIIDIAEEKTTLSKSVLLKLLDPKKLISDIIFSIVTGSKMIYDATIGYLIGSFMKNFYLDSKNNKNNKKGGKKCIDKSFMNILIMILCPPLAIFMNEGMGSIFYVIIASFLTYFYYFPGLIYSCLYIL